MIRPVIEYASPAFHPMLTAAQAGTIEQLQAYKFMFGWNVSYKTALEHTSTERAEDRRTTLVQNFALKSSKNDRFKRWFPLNHQIRYALEKNTSFRLVPKKPDI